MQELDPERKLRVYELIISRYKEIINKEESRSLSELRQKISPYNDFIRSLVEKLIPELQPYSYEKHFFSALQKCIDYIKEIYNLKLPIQLTLEFKEIDELKAGPVLDQALLFCSLLRSLGSPDARVYITQAKYYVGFKFNDESYLVDPESGSILRGADAENAFKEDKLKCTFNDLYFETFDE